MKKQFTPLALAAAICAVSVDADAQTSAYRQTFKAGTHNSPSNGSVVLVEASAVNQGIASGSVFARENAGGTVDVVAPGDPAYVAGVGTGSQLHLATGSSAVLNRFGIDNFTPNGTAGHFYGAFTVLTNPLAGQSVSFAAGNGSALNITGASAATTIQIHRYNPDPSTNTIRITATGQAVNLIGINDFWNYQGTNKIEVYVNNTSGVSAAPMNYSRCGNPMTLPAGKQHVYLNGNLLTLIISASSGGGTTTDLNAGPLTNTDINDVYMVSSATTGSRAIIDDIIYTNDVTAGLTGTYTIDANASLASTFPDLATLQKAFDCDGVTGALTVNFEPGTYQGALSLGQYNFPIVLNGNNANLNKCVPSASQNVNLITLDGTDNITVTNFNLNATCNYGTGIRVMNDAQNVVITGNDIALPFTGGNSSSVHNKGIWVSGGTALTIQGNTITGGRRGMQIEGILANQVNVSANTVNQSFEYGIGLANLGGSNLPNLVTNNRVDMRNAYASSVGIQATSVGGIMLDGNYITGASRGGMVLTNVALAGYANNRIGGFVPSTNTTQLVNGIFHNGGTMAIFAHNSILLDQGAGGAALRTGSIGTIAAVNNIFAYTGTGASVPLSGARSAFAQLSHNNYYNATGGSIATLNGAVADLTALSNLGFATAGSFAENPNFTPDLRPMNANMRNVATAPALVNVDFEGDPRMAGSIDLGADQAPVVVPGRFAATKALEASVYPNPFQESVTVELKETVAGQVQVTLVDLMGRQVFTQAYSVEKGSNAINVQVDQSIAQGVYLLQVTQGDATSTYRVVKQ